jgi:type II secretory pathway pseudopilin PulG
MSGHRDTPLSKAGLRGRDREELRLRGNAGKGFTQIELVAVVAVLVAMTAFMTPTYLKYLKRSRAVLTLAAVKDALGELAKDTGRWPGGAPPFHAKDRGPYQRPGAYADLTAADVGIFNDKGGAFSKDSGWKGPYMPGSALDPATGGFLDPWGTPYFMDYGYNVNGKQFVVVGSAGPDRRGVNLSDTDNIYVIVGQ